MPSVKNKDGLLPGDGRRKLPTHGTALPQPTRVREERVPYDAFSGGPKEPLSVPWNKRIVIELWGDPLGELNPNLAGWGAQGRDSLMKKRRIEGKWKHLATSAWEAAGSPVYTVPVVIAFDIRRGRKMDPDNCLAGLKKVIDGLTTRTQQKILGPGGVGMIPDDTEEWVSYAPVTMLTGGFHTQNPSLFIAVTPKEPESGEKTQKRPKDACLEGENEK